MQKNCIIFFGASCSGKSHALNAACTSLNAFSSLEMDSTNYYKKSVQNQFKKSSFVLPNSLNEEVRNSILRLPTKTRICVLEMIRRLANENHLISTCGALPKPDSTLYKQIGDAMHVEFSFILISPHLAKHLLFIAKRKRITRTREFISQRYALLDWSNWNAIINSKTDLYNYVLGLQKKHLLP